MHAAASRIESSQPARDKQSNLKRRKKSRRVETIGIDLFSHERHRSIGRQVKRSTKSKFRLIIYDCSLGGFFVFWNLAVIIEESIWKCDDKVIFQ